MKTRKRAVIGEQRELGGRMYIKTSSGWKYVGKGKGSKAKQHIDSHKESSITHQERLQYPKSMSDKDIVEVKNRMDEFRKKAKEQQINRHDQLSTELDRLKSIPRSKRTEAQNKAIKDLTLKIGEIENPQNSSSEEKSTKKRAELGEERTFGGRTYVKTESDWKYKGKGSNNIPHLDEVKKMFEESSYMSNTPDDEKINFIEGRVGVEGGSKEDANKIHNHLKDSGFYDKVKKKHQNNS